MKREWLDNPFWDHPQEERTALKAILRITDDEDRVTTEVRRLEKGPADDLNPEFQEVIDQIGIEKINANTTERLERLAKEEQARETHQQEREQAKKLEKLFNAKLQAFEIDAVKDSTNRELKTRLRRAKSIIEVNVYAMMIVMDSLQNAESEN